MVARSTAFSLLNGSPLPSSWSNITAQMELLLEQFTTARSQVSSFIQPSPGLPLWWQTFQYGLPILQSFVQLSRQLVSRETLYIEAIPLHQGVVSGRDEQVCSYCIASEIHG
jgi:hypothetical protein